MKDIIVLIEMSILVNKIRNTYINYMFDTTSNKDSLNKLLLNFFPSSDNLEMILKKDHLW